MNFQTSAMAAGNSGLTRPPLKVPVTHQHIFTILQTLIAEGRVPRSDRPLRILDIGCGDGRLINSLQSLFTRHMPELQVEICGFDIGEHGFKDSSQLSGTLELLTENHPGIDWSNRVRLISDGDPWGYEAGSFDLAVSNQVIEHVEDLQHFLVNLRETLAPGGQSVHVFPLSQCMQEAHCLVPFSHWIKDYNYRVAWIALLSRLGIGRYRVDRKLLGHDTVARHAEETAKFIECWTTYRSFGEIARMAGNLSMATSYHFTKNLLPTKLRQMMGRKPARKYRRWTPFGIEWLSYLFVRSMTSATLVISPLRYDIGERIAKEKAYRAHREQHEAMREAAE
ncbi:SAM-dependent methyltransferase [Altererythrobacter atlanticus]|uniref:Uncharacterized protein n=1 Tax=Croceibacterium atlanticum TaxID=1267766 RepID=A0A0F7KVP0_9SPHN|nr:class I SAM-dependent methyltransferase [Croceibacterium atlanticum]AKH42840.1 hypothetical protein WYH_01804 [Croceibacterium atlanticum]MBB5731620.1 SAM-dependent methyltransferase [Croceibacterium atlanticum]